jgi:hypothetical protein
VVLSVADGFWFCLVFKKMLAGRESGAFLHHERMLDGTRQRVLW